MELKTAKTSKNTNELRQLEILFDIIPAYSSFSLFAKEKARLKKSGELIPDFDLLIGCTAVTNHLVMVSNYLRHLQRIKGIQLQNWIEPTFNQFIDT